MSIIRCTRMHLASAAALLAAAALAVLFAFPLSAQAMEVERWTAQPNDDALEKVMGATPTRVTWQGQTAEDESLSALAIDLPEGSSVDAGSSGLLSSFPPVRILSGCLSLLEKEYILHPLGKRSVQSHFFLWQEKSLFLLDIDLPFLLNHLLLMTSSYP